MHEERAMGIGVPDDVTPTEVAVVAKLRKKPEAGTPERREYERVHKTHQREVAKQKKSAESAKYTSNVVPSKAEAKEYLASRIPNQHVIDTCYDLGLIAAERLGITANKFMWLHGVQKLLQSMNEKRECFLDIKHDEVVQGETIYLGDLYFLWDMSISWRDELGFEEFLRIRNRCKTDAFELGLVLGKDFHEKPHGTWRDFYPRYDAGLKPGYTQEDVKQWHASISPVKDRMLLASRNAYKSSWNIVWAVGAVLNCADLRLLFCSETTKLSKGFIRAFRGYFENNERNPTRFQQLFPEHCIPVGDGSGLFFESPMRTLNMIQYTAESTSFESSVAGQRADVIIYDDPISDKSTGTVETCEKGVNTFSAIQKLREVGGYSLIAGTPWRADLDLYAVLIKNIQNDNQSEHSEKMQIRIDPAWTVLPHARHKNILHLVEEDVDLLFPNRLTWKFLQKELRSGAGNTVFFRMQNLCEFVSDDDQIKVTFTREQLYAAVRSVPPDGQRILRVTSVDSAFSVARTADFSCLVTADIYEQQSTRRMFVHDVKLERMKTSELGVLVAETLNRLKPDRVLVERTGDWVSLQDAIRNAAIIRGYALPDIFWKPVSSVAGASIPVKTARAKGMEPLVADGRLLFSAEIPILESCFQQMVHFDGVTRSGSSPGSKDDFVDALSLLVQSARISEYVEPISEVQEEFERQAEISKLLKLQHDWYFGVPVQHQQPIYNPPSEGDVGAIHGTLGRFGLTRNAV
jgi:hypothetical protein